MKKNFLTAINSDIFTVENQLHDIGNQLSVIKSLANFLYLGLSGESEMELSDNSNLASILYSMIDDVNNKFNNLEIEVNI